MFLGEFVRGVAAAASPRPPAPPARARREPSEHHYIETFGKLRPHNISSVGLRIETWLGCLKSRHKFVYEVAETFGHTVRVHNELRINTLLAFIVRSHLARAGRAAANVISIKNVICYRIFFY